MLKYFKPLLDSLTDHPKLARWAVMLPEQITSGLCEKRFGDLASWRTALEALPLVTTQHIDLQSGVIVGSAEEQPEAVRQCIRQQLEQLIPWRKGPYQVHGTFIDTEWRSDWKWDRVLPHLSPLKGKTVLDVGCGNGYHCWRMFGEGAERVIGIDPSPRFIVQFLMLKHFIGNVPVDVLPLPMEAVAENLQAFDTVFSMGVLYHRRSPIDHIMELKGALKPGGELVLETLIIEGDEGKVLVPEGRYAMMNNVWFLPSAPTLLGWLRKCGFTAAKVVDINQTSTDEQRQTDWMRFHSLANFLDPNDHSKTAEGHPAPLRAVVTAQLPGG